MKLLTDELVNRTAAIVAKARYTDMDCQAVARLALETVLPDIVETCAVAARDVMAQKRELTSPHEVLDAIRAVAQPEKKS